MPKKTYILIVILVFIAGILIFVAIRNEQKKVEEQGPKTATPSVVPTIVPFATLSFPSPTMDLSDSKSTQESVDVLINTSGKPVFGAQVELSYDPEIISGVSISNPEGSFFGQNASVLINEINQETGRVSYAISLPTQAEEKTGQGVVMKMTFKVNKEKAKETLINFLPKSMITSLKSPSSVLDQTVPLKLILSE